MSKQKKQTSNEVKKFGIEEATKLASSYIPKDDKDRYTVVEKNGDQITSDNYDVMFVTSDKNVFFKSKEGQARNHANKFKLELFTVKPGEK